MVETQHPGSNEAIDRGCTCPILDNCHGLGCNGYGKLYGWVMTSGCPLHDPWKEKGGLINMWKEKVDK